MKSSFGQTKSKSEWLVLRYEMNPTVTVYQRSVYTVFDWMRDIGGIFFFTAMLGSFCNSLFNYNKLENQIVAQLYKRPKLKDDNPKDKGNLHASEQSTSLELCLALCCRKRKFCGLGDRTDRWFNLGRRSLVRETSVQTILRSIRAFNTYLEQKVPSNELEKIKNSSKKMPLKYIYPNETSDSNVISDSEIQVEQQQSYQDSSILGRSDSQVSVSTLAVFSF